MEKSGQQNYPADAPPGYGEHLLHVGHPGNQPNYPSNQPPSVGNPGYQPNYPSNQPPSAGNPGYQPDYPSNQPPSAGYPGNPQPVQMIHPMSPGHPAAGYPYVQPQTAYSHQNNTTIVTQPYPTTTIIQGNQYVASNLGFAIFTCLLCCWPFGAVAIYMSCQSKDALENNNIPLAQQKARSARNFAIAALCCGIVIIGVSIAHRVVWYNSNTHYYSSSG